ncbi:MAG: SagB/ThcOx family dehydrogenase [Candidatus Omnitrophica bacterium]|nr:SagB/ThcOx family dehydrogenase [Candidatus Omnitrophota bacterium]
MTDLRLPQPKLVEGKNLRQNMQERYSNRSFDNKKALTLNQLSTILWATYGKKIKGIDAITSASYVIPSAGAVYALEIFILVGKNAVENLGEGLYYYIKEKHALKIISSLDKRKNLALACLNQKFVEDAPVSIIITAQFGSMAQRYGKRAERYVVLEAGHAAQNLYLIANDLGLTTVEVGAFIDNEVTKVLDIKYPVLLIMPIGYKK